MRSFFFVMCVLDFLLLWYVSKRKYYLEYVLADMWTFNFQNRLGDVRKLPQ